MRHGRGAVETAGCGVRGGVPGRPPRSPEGHVGHPAGAPHRPAGGRRWRTHRGLRRTPATAGRGTARRATARGLDGLRPRSPRDLGVAGKNLVHHGTSRTLASVWSVDQRSSSPEPIVRTPRNTAPEPGRPDGNQNPPPKQATPWGTMHPQGAVLYGDRAGGMRAPRASSRQPNCADDAAYRPIPRDAIEGRTRTLSRGGKRNGSLAGKCSSVQKGGVRVIGGEKLNPAREPTSSRAEDPCCPSATTDMLNQGLSFAIEA